MKFQKLAFVALFTLVAGVGCATTNRAPYSDSEVELAQRRAEDEAFARLAASTNTEIADSASTVAQQRATR